MSIGYLLSVIFRLYCLKKYLATLIWDPSFISKKVVVGP